jgi:hypothetical protein
VLHHQPVQPSMQVLGMLKSPVRLLASSNTLVALLHSG